MSDTSWSSPSISVYRLVIHILYAQLGALVYRHIHLHLQPTLPKDFLATCAQRLENTLVTASELVRRVLRHDLVGMMPAFLFVTSPLSLSKSLSSPNILYPIEQRRTDIHTSIDSISQLSAICVERSGDISPGSGRTAAFRADLAVHLAYLEEAGKKWKVARIYHGGLKVARDRAD